MMREIAERGEPRSDRTGVGTLALFGMRAEFDLRDGFPAATTKKLYFGQVRAELAAFLAGAESLEEFHRHGCTIWDKNAADWKSPRFPGDVGRGYGVQWRGWRRYEEVGGSLHYSAPLDQMRALVDGLRKDPHGRRHIVQTWNPGELAEMCLPPCHVLSQAFASDYEKMRGEPLNGAVMVKEKWLDLHFHMRSLDVFLGMPFDVASHALVLCLLAREVGRLPRMLIMTSGDTHLYRNHLLQADEARSRRPFPPPALSLTDDAGLLQFQAGDAWLSGYEHHPAIYAPMNV